LVGNWLGDRGGRLRIQEKGTAPATAAPPRVVAFPAAPVASQAPVPTGYHLTTQKKMQAVEHWSLLAEDIAGQIHKGLGPRQAALPASVLRRPLRHHHF
jgi:hypothetical protein